MSSALRSRVEALEAQSPQIMGPQLPVLVRVVDGQAGGGLSPDERITALRHMRGLTIRLPAEPLPDLVARAAVDAKPCRGARPVLMATYVAPDRT